MHAAVAIGSGLALFGCGALHEPAPRESKPYVFAPPTETRVRPAPELAALSRKLPGPCRSEVTVLIDGRERVDTYRYEYDAADREVLLAYDQGSDQTVEHEVRKSYDARGRLTKMEESDLLEGRSVSSQTEYRYDDAGRLIGESWDLDSDGVIDDIVSYKYGAVGVVEEAYDQGADGKFEALTRYEYDAAGRLSKASGGRTSMVESYSYDAVGRLFLREWDRENDGQIDLRHTLFYADTNDPIRREVDGSLMAFRAADGRVDERVTFDRDIHGNLLRQDTDLGADGIVEQSAIYHYDCWP